jgi:transcriptional regulator with PAS, ATPase and Fis domain
LKVLEEQTFRRVGGTTEIKVDIRLISATSRDLPRLVAEQKFRSDLFYRLNVTSVHLPPLRERGEDILILANHYLKVFAREFKRQMDGISPRAGELLLNHEWIGNVRELRNVIERGVLFEKASQLTAESLGFMQVVQSGEPATQCDNLNLQHLELPADGLALEELEKAVLEAALKRHDGNKSKAAAFLHISRQTMKYRLKKYAI